MPVVDMPIEKLQKYQGITPCPADFDAVWDGMLCDLDKLELQYTLKDSGFETAFAECLDLYFIGTKGAKVHAKYWRPKHAKEKSPILLKFHGYACASEEWTSNLHYVAEGFCVAEMDCRGQNGCSEMVERVSGSAFHNYFIRGLEGPVEDMPYVQVFLDTAMLAKVVKSLPETDETRVAVTGGSQGGGLSVACAALVPDIKLAAPIYPFLSDYKRVWQMDQCNGAYKEVRDYFRNYDPLHEREEEIFTKLGYVDVQNFAKRIRAEVQMTTCLMDTTCPASTQFAIYNKLTCKKKHLIYPDFGHEKITGNQPRVFQFLRQLKSM